MYKTLITFFLLLVCSFMQSYANMSIDLEKNETELYEEAVSSFRKRKYKKAIKVAQRIEDLYPISHYAMKAKLLSGISHYYMKNYDSAACDMDDYIRIYSNGEDLSYAYYLRVLSYYMKINKIQLEQQTAYRALELATEYTNLFPKSEYIDQVKEKLMLITEHISAKEYYIGKFYLKRGEYLSAIKRFQNIASNKNSRYFSKSTCYLIAAYLALGLDLEAQQYQYILVKKNLKNKTKQTQNYIYDQ
ncbi:MAG: outer membrane protein assembly factor BamD [Wolbachia endosymbiont of Meromenopon meropis]|nr:outer membrane protein assembly factor BamD [Wolbachia endosymbiont of Meromenopon meropis]